MMKLSLKDYLYVVLFLGCLIFVSHRGLTCFQKFIAKPEGVDIGYHFSSREPFPSFTFCHQLPARIRKECDILSTDYRLHGKWNTFNGSQNCTDPYDFKQHAIGNFMDLDILELAIVSYDSYFFLEIFELEQLGNETLFEWSSILETEYYMVCHTLTFKESVTDHGIKEVNNVVHVLNIHHISIKFCLF